MTSSRRILGALTALLLVCSLSSCGDPVKKYCSALNADRTAIANMLAQPSPTALISNLPMLQSLGANAPEDLTDEWQTFLGAIVGLRDALHAAGVRPEQFHDGRPPVGLPAGRRQAIKDAADTLSSLQVVQAADGIDQEARDVCQINLGM
ncbi:MAG: hypothetical protein M3Z50_02715 [Actinomycetota bacterium]|nr:hypothetical protein [Actinomycetota bacterium]